MGTIYLKVKNIFSQYINKKDCIWVKIWSQIWTQIQFRNLHDYIFL